MQLARLIGQRVRARRRALGMTQRQLAGKLGLTYQQVQHYESGTDNITASRLQEIALALDVSPGSFFPPHKELPSAWGSRDKQAGSE